MGIKRAVQGSLYLFQARFFIKVLTPPNTFDIVSFFRRGVEQHGSSSGS